MAAIKATPSLFNNFLDILETRDSQLASTLRNECCECYSLVWSMLSVHTIIFMIYSKATWRTGVSSIQCETGGVLTSLPAGMCVEVLHDESDTPCSLTVQITLSLCTWTNSRDSTKLHLQHGCHFQSVSILN